MRSKKFLLVLVVFLLGISLVGCGSQGEKGSPKESKAASQEPADNAKILKVGLVPNQAPDQMKAKYEPFKAYLQETLGIEVELYVANNYAGVVEAMASGKLDMAYFGGLTYVQAKQRAKIHPIVTEIDSETKTTKYYSLIITPADSKIKSVAELKDKTFAFGDVSSTSGSLYPRIMLDQAGLKIPDDFANVIYTGKHDATAMAVEKGKVDAGGLEGRILNKLIADGQIDKTKIRILAKSDMIEGYPWVVIDSMDKELENKIIEAFLAMNDEELLKLLKAEGFAKVTKEDYKYIEEQAARLGLLK
ncbi:putative selenate ABC transporter substrate-binding protein [Desulfotomaculum defluvii]